MTAARDAWKEVGDRLTALGLKLKLHAEEELSDRDDDDRDADAWARLRSAFEEVAEALGDASRDPAVRADVRSALDALGDAANATVAEIRQAMTKDRRPGS
jgi:hypothetical protein